MKTVSTKFWFVLSLVIPAAITHASVLRFHAKLSGATEIPAIVTTATGFADVYLDTDAHTLQVNITWSGLAGTTTAAHIHAPGTAAQISTAVPFNGTWAVATQPTTFVAFPMGTTAGSYVGATYSLLSATNYTPGYVTGNGGTPATAETALVAYLLSGKTYLNVHSTFATGGEIKGYLQFVSAADSATKLINVSARAKVGAGDDVLIAGFVVTGTVPRTVLIRAAGPTLTGFGVGGVLADPQLEVTQAVAGVNTVVASNDNWGGIPEVAAATTAVGAFPFASATSNDAAVLVTLAPGLYSAKVSGVGNTVGNALVEVYAVP